MLFNTMLALPIVIMEGCHSIFAHPPVMPDLRYVDGLTTKVGQV